jgi:hypothetical protein
VSYRLGQLPSEHAAQQLVAGEPGALANVVGTVALRAGLIWVGLALAGVQERRVVGALAASAAIESFVLGWVLFERRRARAIVPARVNPGAGDV